MMIIKRWPSPPLVVAADPLSPSSSLYLSVSPWPGLSAATATAAAAPAAAAAAATAARNLRGKASRVDYRIVYLLLPRE